MTSRIQSVWRALDTIAAQLGQAGVSFMTTLTFVHVLSASEFGFVAAFWSVWLILMAMNRAVFGEQLIAQSYDARLRRVREGRGYLDFGYIWASAGVVVSILIAFLADFQSLIPAILTVAFFVVSDMVRYGVMAEDRKEPGRGVALLPLELVRISSSAVALFMALANFSAGLPTVFALASSLVWIIFGLGSTGVPSFRRAVSFVRRKEKFEALMSIQFLTGTGLSQLVPFLALHAFGAAPFGAMRLAQSVLAPITVLTSAFQPSLIRVYSSNRHSRRFSKIVAVSVLSSLCVGVLMTWLAIWGVGIAGDLLIPSAQATAVGDILTPTAVILSLVVVGQPGGALIKVFRLGAVSLSGQIIGIIVTLVLAVLATQHDLKTFVWALATGSASTVIATYGLLIFGLARARFSRVADGNTMGRNVA
jgi:O-antigen/teichoic acid export membrane protein